MKISNKIIACMLVGVLGLTGCGTKVSINIEKDNKKETVEEKETTKEKKETEKERETETEKETERETLGSITDDINKESKVVDSDNEVIGYIGNKDFIEDIQELVGEYLTGIFDTMAGNIIYNGTFDVEVDKEEATKLIIDGYDKLVNSPKQTYIFGIEFKIDDEVGDVAESKFTGYQLNKDSAIMLKVVPNENGIDLYKSSTSKYTMNNKGNLEELKLYGVSKIDKYTTPYEFSIKYDNVKSGALEKNYFTYGLFDNLGTTDILYARYDKEYNAHLIVAKERVFDREYIILIENGEFVYITYQSDVNVDNGEIAESYIIRSDGSYGFSEVAEMYLGFGIRMPNDIIYEVLENFDKEASSELKEEMNWNLNEVVEYCKEYEESLDK